MILFIIKNEKTVAFQTVEAVNGFLKPVNVGGVSGGSWDLMQAIASKCDAECSDLYVEHNESGYVVDLVYSQIRCDMMLQKYPLRPDFDQWCKNLEGYQRALDFDISPRGKQDFYDAGLTPHQAADRAYNGS